ncbi:metallophosphoesterase family protein [Desulforhopalus sp. 52FAK]
MTCILLISDIHGNYPALQAIGSYFCDTHFDKIINCGDSTVYAPFPNETLDWLRSNNTISILGNTDKKVIKLLQGKSFKKPGKADKRIMYETTAQELTLQNGRFLQGLPKKSSYSCTHIDKGISPTNTTIGVYHGSPAAHHEFLFADTKKERFIELTELTDADIVVTGHSHTPYHKKIGDVHFVNPGSVGRMFDGNPESSCAVLLVSDGKISVRHYRIPYNIETVTDRIAQSKLPAIYSKMYREGRKLN